MDADFLEAAGFATDLVVVRPSLEGDGLIDEDGGTVADEAYPDRAKVTFPPGALAGETDVAIDVFPDPLAIPTPTGFQGPGTMYVNVSLVPEPNQPFPAPGVTLTLPLEDFINPGTAIPLFSVDPDTGELVPMLDPDGEQVIGFVNADGLSASFFGITHFSIVVGLLPATVDDLVARAKSGKVSLAWSPIADALGYNVYRSDTASGPYDLIAANYVTSHAAYLDATVTNGSTYYYIVKVIGDGYESNESNEAEVAVTGRSRRRR